MGESGGRESLDEIVKRVSGTMEWRGQKKEINIIIMGERIKYIIFF